MWKVKFQYALFTTISHDSSLKDIWNQTLSPTVCSNIWNYILVCHHLLNVHVPNNKSSLTARTKDFILKFSVKSIRQLTLWSRTLLERLAVDQLVKKLPSFYGTQRYVTMFTRIPPLDHTLSQINPVHILTLCFFTINFNIIHPLTSRSPIWILPLTFFDM